MTDEQRKMVEGALALEASLEGRTVGAADLLMPARLAGPLARLVMEVEEQNARLRSDNADLLATSDAYQHMHTRAVRAEEALEETRLDLKVESGAESGAPHPDWRCSNGRLRLYHRYYGGDLHAVVNADGDWMLYRAGGNMLEVKEEIASGPPQLKRSAMIAADAAATRVQEKP